MLCTRYSQAGRLAIGEIDRNSGIRDSGFGTRSSRLRDSGRPFVRPVRCLHGSSGALDPPSEACLTQRLLLAPCRSRHDDLAAKLSRGLRNALAGPLVHEDGHD
jgi:hypothetical protein